MLCSYTYFLLNPFSCLSKSQMHCPYLFPIIDALLLPTFPIRPIPRLGKSVIHCSYLFPIKPIQCLWKSLMHWCFVPTYFLLNPLNVFGKVYYVIRPLNFIKLRSGKHPSIGKHAQHWYRLSYPRKSPNRRFSFLFFCFFLYIEGISKLLVY